ncbi:MAG TPA: RluA family pseudouridine synthase [Planctomycetota bacterium]|nr:RluA family pseudouridine synthase [Planctomycetota bacterium]
MAGSAQVHHITAAEAGQRLDRFLRKLLPAVPLGAIFKHLRQGNVRIDGRKAAPSLRLQEGMALELQARLAPADVAAAPTGPAPAFRGAGPAIVFQDQDLLVVDKPAGMASQPGSGQHRTDLVSWLLAAFADRRTATFAPAPAHRIDRGTSGLVAIGLSPRGLRGLTAAFRDGAVEKVYLAVVHGVPAPARGTIDLPLLEQPASRADQPKVRVDLRGRPARTDYQLLAQRERRALLRVTIGTGRMHQIRAHLAHLGHPIVGDHRYGSAGQRGDLLLHSSELRLEHPVTGAPLDLRATAPASFPFVSG